MLIARQNGHIDQAAWMKKAAGPVKGRKRETDTQGKSLHSSDGALDGHTHTHARLIHFNESREKHKGITSINAKSIQHNRGYKHREGIKKTRHP